MNNKRFEDEDVQCAILSAIAAKPTGSITNAEIAIGGRGSSRDPDQPDFPASISPQHSAHAA
jgi:hypothetical protein